MKQVTVISDFLPQKEWDDVFWDYLAKPNWKFGHTSDKKSPSVKMVPTYWKMNLDSHSLFTLDMVKRIEEATGDKLLLDTVYAGGNTFGTSGDLHYDHHLENARTLLYHASPDVWNPMWGGKTIFHPENAEKEYYEFEPNQALYFKSNILHYGEPTTKHFEGLRICIAFKLFVL